MTLENIINSQMSIKSQIIVVYLENSFFIYHDNHGNSLHNPDDDVEHEGHNVSLSPSMDFKVRDSSCLVFLSPDVDSDISCRN